MKVETRLCVVVLFAGLCLASLFVSAAELNYSASWVGNSYNGKRQWVLQDVEDVFVDTGGTLFTNVYWDEAGGNVQEYREGKLVRMAGHTHGWGYEGGSAVAANSKYLFIVQNVNNEGGHLKGNSWPPAGFTWSGISRRLRADISKPAPFPGGHGKEGAVLQRAFLPIVEMPARKQAVGLRGAWATEDRLLVSSPFDDSIKCYDTETMQLVKSWHVDRPDKICMDHGSRVWVLQKPEAGKGWAALSFDLNGKALPGRIDFEKGILPTDLCVDRSGRLLVADAGPDQQIKMYEGPEGSPRLAGTFGQKGGIVAGPVPGRFGDGRFNLPMGVGADAKGNIYVASSGSSALETGGGGSTVLECYSPDGKCAWRVFGMEFIDLASLDPASETDAYTKEEHFVIDYARPAGQEWSYRGYTVDKFKYPDDPRQHIWSAGARVRRIAGQKFLFVSDMTGEFLQVYRFSPQTDGEIAIPCALFSKRHVNNLHGYPPHQPDKGEWIWLDRNGNGAIDADEYLTIGGKDAAGIYVPDERGSIWLADKSQIRCLPMQGVDAHGVPVWNFAKARTWPRPTELDQVRRLEYLPDQDVLIVGGNRGDDHNQHWKPMGPVLCCFDHWSTDARKLRWNVMLPYENGAHGHESAEPMSFDMAGEYLFVAYTRGLPEEGMKWAFVKVYRLSDMSFVGNLTCDNRLGEVGLLDIVDSVHAGRRSNGEYVVFMEDDAKSKVVMFRWKP